jgi:hypothetical protein
VNRTSSYPTKVSAHLEEFLVQEFEHFYYNHLGLMAEFLPGDFFGSVQAKAIVAHIHLITRKEQPDLKLICKIIGSQFFAGQVEEHAQAVKQWLSGSFYLQFINDCNAHTRHMEKEVLQLQEERENYLIQHKLDVAAPQKEKRMKLAAEKAESKKQAAEEMLASCDQERKIGESNWNVEQKQKAEDLAEAKIQRRWAIQANKAKAAANRSKQTPMKNITNQLPFDNSLDGGSISIPRG